MTDSAKDIVETTVYEEILEIYLSIHPWCNFGRRFSTRILL